MGLVRKPKLSDVVAMKRLLDSAVTSGDVLFRQLPELYENVRDFYVYMDDEGLAGCAALHIDTAHLAEVRSLVVHERLRGTGVGLQLLQAVLDEARRLDIAQVYALTRVPEFFAKIGFRVVDPHELPFKVFKDCIRCRLFPGCDEVTMVKDLLLAEMNTDEEEPSAIEREGALIWR